MYYEFYIDQFFLEQFLTDTLLVWLAALAYGERISLRRMFAGGLAGAAAMTLLIWQGSTRLFFLSMLTAGIAAFWEKGNACFWRKLSALFFVTLCFGGTFAALSELFGLKFLAGSLFSVLLVRFVLGWQRRRRQELETEVKVRIFRQEKELCIRGLVDTGNSLREPLTGKPVSILSKEAAEELLGKEWETDGCYLIPYHSIGREQGWMRAVAADRMCAEQNGETAEYPKPILAVSEERLDQRGRYQIILHPEHVREMSARKKRKQDTSESTEWDAGGEIREEQAERSGLENGQAEKLENQEAGKL